MNTKSFLDQYNFSSLCLHNEKKSCLIRKRKTIQAGICWTFGCFGLLNMHHHAFPCALKYNDTFSNRSNFISCQKQHLFAWHFITDFLLDYMEKINAAVHELMQSQCLSLLLYVCLCVFWDTLLSLQAKLPAQGQYWSQFPLFVIPAQFFTTLNVFNTVIAETKELNRKKYQESTNVLPKFWVT